MKKLEMFKISNWPLWVQIFAIISLLFGLFIILQQFVTYNIFNNYYEQRQASQLNGKVSNLVNELDTDPFNATFNFIKENDAYVYILSSNNELILDNNEYAIWLNNDKFLLPNISYLYNIGDFVYINLSDNEIVSIKINENTIFYNDFPITESIYGQITDITNPSNLNSFFIYRNDNLHNELSYLNDAALKKYNVNESTYWFSHENSANPSYNNLVYVSSLSNGNVAITIFSISGTIDMINALNTYNFYTYIAILFIILFTSWYASKLIARPFENITYVANELANLNFDVAAKEFTNRESTTLTNSINKMNNSLKNTIDKLNNQNNEMRELSLKQKQQFETKKQFVSAISHEIKTPLAIIQATVSGILDGIFDESEYENELKNVLKEINSTTDMLQEVLDVYKLDSDSFKLELESLDLVKFTQKIINSFDLVLQNSNMNVKYTYEEDKILILGDYRQLKRVISNLLVNAIKYSPEKTTIDINLKTSKKEVLFEVSNYGVTIPEKDVDNIFEPFYRVDKTGNRTERKKGSGLGLYIVKQILEKHNYEFGLKNIENGVTFYFVAKKDNKIDNIK